MAQDRIVEVGTASETTKPVPQESTKPQVSEKADTKKLFQVKLVMFKKNSYQIQEVQKVKQL